MDDILEEESDDEEESDTEGKEETDTVPSDEKKFHYIITCRDKQTVRIPEAIVLDNPYPRESPVMKKRSFSAVLRFNKAKRDDPLKFMLHELMLYRPTRNEFDMDRVEFFYNETFNGKSKEIHLNIDLHYENYHVVIMIDQIGRCNDIKCYSIKRNNSLGN